jgi:tetratricopeptide (TPR) repeat protein
MYRIVKSSIAIIGVCLFIIAEASAQLTTIADGGNRKASVSERVGITDITVDYSRPAVKDRQDKIWGQLVHYGFIDLGFGTSKAAPWRAGANENTTIEFSTRVKIEGRDLSAGKYGFFIAVGPEESTLIFSKSASAWGSFYYDDKEDALRVKVKNAVMQQSVERLKYEFIDQTNNSAVIALLWEKWKIAFKVEVDLQNLQLESFRRELTSEKAFLYRWMGYHQAADYCLSNNINLEEGLIWANKSISEPFIGEPNFATLSTKAGILRSLGRNTESDSIMKAALPFGSMNEVHNYGRRLLAGKRTAEALEVFKMNATKYPNTFTTNMGLARGYSAMGDFKKALKYAQMAQQTATDKVNKDFVDKLIGVLKEGKDIN